MTGLTLSVNTGTSSTGTKSEMTRKWTPRTLADYQLIQAYDDQGLPRFLNANGEPIAGIYLGVKNGDYHAIPACSSTKLKKFAKSPALYYRAYIKPLNRRKTEVSTVPMETGDLIHALVLEPERAIGLYFYWLLPVDYPNALHTVDDIKKALIQAGVKPVGTKKDDLIEQLRWVDHSAFENVFDVMNKQHIYVWACSKNPAWTDVPSSSALVSRLDDLVDLLKKHCGVAEPGADRYTVIRQLLTIDASLGDIIFDVVQARHMNAVMNSDEYQEFTEKYVIDPIMYQDAHRACQTVRAHRSGNRLLQDGYPEVTMIAQDPMTGMWLKSKIDWLRFDLIAVDLKSARSAEPDNFRYQTLDLRYCLQEVFYRYVANLLDVDIQAFPFVCVEFAEMDACEVFELSERRKDKAFEALMKLLPELKSCLDDNFWYGYNAEQDTIVID